MCAQRRVLTRSDPSSSTVLRPGTSTESRPGGRSSSTGGIPRYAYLIILLIKGPALYTYIYDMKLNYLASDYVLFNLEDFYIWLIIPFSLIFLCCYIVRNCIILEMLKSFDIYLRLSAIFEIGGFNQLSFFLNTIKCKAIIYNQLEEVLFVQEVLTHFP